MSARRIRHAGFTLIEILVVLVIIGVVLTFATLSVNPNSAGDRLDAQSKRLLALTRAAADQAILSGHTIGLQLTAHGYRFIELKETGWHPITSGDTPLRPRRLDDDIYLDRIRPDGNDAETNRQAQSLARPVSPTGLPNPTDRNTGQNADNDNADKPLAVPAALFLSSGELLPFTLEISSKGVNHRFDISGAPNGDIRLKRVDR